MRRAAALLALQALPGVGEQSALHFSLLTGEADPFDEHYRGAWERALAEAEEEIGRCEAVGIAVLSVFDPRYPRRLAAAAHPPPVIYVQGSVDVLQRERAVALAGGREPSEAALAGTGRLVGALAERRWTLVAGLDPVGTAAHVAAMGTGTATIAVMPGGLERTPARSQAQVQEIVDAGGAVVSPFRVGLPSNRSTLSGRDRLLVRLGRALILTEAAEDDGVMHTAIQAATYDRPVLVVEPAADGLRVLLETPASRLHERLAAWRGKSALATRVGDRPLAEAISSEDPDALMAVLEKTPDPLTGEVGARAWWPGIGD